jgi:hypothetical protein
MRTHAHPTILPESSRLLHSELAVVATRTPHRLTWEEHGVHCYNFFAMPPIVGTFGMLQQAIAPPRQQYVQQRHQKSSLSFFATRFPNTPQYS